MPDALQLAFERQHGCFADVAQEHVRFLHLIERRGEGRSDRFFDKAFAQADPKIAGQDLDDILAFARR